MGGVLCKSSSSVSVVDGPAYNEAPPRVARDRWMGYVKAQAPGAGELRLGGRSDAVFLPGTHDAGVYDCNGLLELVKEHFAKAQEYDFAEQLASGVRIFDLRVDVDGGGFRFKHGPVWGDATVADLIAALASFYSNPARLDEIVVLDFTHWGDGMGKADSPQDTAGAVHYQRLAEEFIKHPVLGPLLAKRREAVNTSLKHFWDAGTPIALSFHFDNIGALATDDKVWSGSDIFAFGWCGTRYWPNTDDPKKMAKRLTELATMHHGDGKVWPMLCVLTPQVKGLKGIEDQVPAAHAELWDRLAPGKVWWTEANMMMVDFFPPRLADLAVEVNLERAAKKSGAGKGPVDNHEE
eukprot:TRINITY_DN17602_c0_g1_i2.p2 TRINITY_DN17602_c0_g1~~TRINITY_DN17602_c0_g1_i2.p2  ORF type:complete len:351 (+),score=109.83 TRINITY_DN17602_c0_g1_i2:51-1103(+)